MNTEKNTVAELEKAVALLQDANAELSSKGMDLRDVSREKAKRRSIQNQLSKFQDETEELEKELAVSQMGVQPPFIAKITLWETKVLNYISRELGESEAVTFKIAEGERSLASHVNSYQPQWRDWWWRLGSKRSAIERLKEQLGIN